MSSWVGASLLSLGEWFIKRMPFVRHIYNASKQISTAISPDQNTQAFKKVAIIRHPRIGEYALDSLLQQLFFRDCSLRWHVNAPNSCNFGSAKDPSRQIQI
ncbi:Protein LIKE COV 1 [Ananas comosus]|uniref:Protein LIKE COV 1 n=1 Tax=Ananas comosus TaxID=4615 RepID=A0A199UNA3_ANACO|nr:Protein LIKE COV 1 [Ananas comosus]